MKKSIFNVLTELFVIYFWKVMIETGLFTVLVAIISPFWRFLGLFGIGIFKESSTCYHRSRARQNGNGKGFVVKRSCVGVFLDLQRKMGKREKTKAKVRYKLSIIQRQKRQKLSSMQLWKKQSRENQRVKVNFRITRYFYFRFN